MNYKKLLMIISIVAGCVLSAKSLVAGTICSGCEVIDGAAGTYIGMYNPESFDNGNFNHTDIQTDLGQGTPFNDFFVFELSQASGGLFSGDFTPLTAISDFVGTLWTDGGSTCDTASALPSICSAIVPGSQLFSVPATDDRWEIDAPELAAGRYIIQVTGTTRVTGPSSYSGQLSFGSDAQIPVPSSLALVLLGLIGVGRMSLRQKKQ